MAEVDRPILNVGAVERRDALGGWQVYIGAVALPVRYPDREEASLIAGRVFDLLQPGHESWWEMLVNADVPARTFDGERHHD